LEGLQAAGERVVEAYVGHFQDIGKRTIVAEPRFGAKGGMEMQLHIGKEENSHGRLLVLTVLPHSIRTDALNEREGTNEGARPRIWREVETGKI
jgi:hypothetical protein